MPEHKLENKFTMYHLSWIFHYSTYSNIYLHKTQTEAKHVKGYHYIHPCSCGLLVLRFLHCICKSHFNRAYTADKFYNLTLESTTLQNLLLASFTIGYLLETKETSVRKCLNKIKWAILENICAN